MTVMTQKGAIALQNRIAQLSKDLAAIGSRKKVAAKVGGDDWHDNFAFEQLEREERMLGQELRRLQDILHVAQIVDPEQLHEQPRHEVRLGATVTIEYENKKSTVFYIGGSGESDPENGILAYDTPLGKAIMRKQVGEEGIFRVGQMEHRIRICKIEWRD